MRSFAKRVDDMGNCAAVDLLVKTNVFPGSRLSSTALAALEDPDVNPAVREGLRQLRDRAIRATEDTDTFFGSIEEGSRPRIISKTQARAIVRLFDEASLEL